MTTHDRIEQTLRDAIEASEQRAEELRLELVEHLAGRTAPRHRGRVQRVAAGTPAWAVREVLAEASGWLTTTEIARRAAERCPIMVQTPSRKIKNARRILDALVAAYEVPIERQGDSWRVEANA